ncbi:reprolysin-like metallopeptidase [Chryseobacterium sp. PMSZPI]|uniref:reprolysin-like metallopeptidase n=1 Tax=Chryseobacterium sp. PMSZPI TaxID=1033900 RepID=UPI000C34B255|nr:zinc-dependent metalloprotease family protein [Chryseobacterium sp. PMSZPI]PKF73672.1 propanediol utilization protein [Chryseobacterium sp. PMSZPI]
MRKRKLLIIALVAGMTATYGQRWEPAAQKNSQINKNVEVQYSYRIDLQSLRNLLKNTVETGNGAKSVVIFLPTVEGKIEKFAVYSNPVMEKSLADQYQLGSYVGVGIDDPSKYLRFSTSPTDMQSMIIKDGVFQFIEPITTDKQTYGVFYKSKEEVGEHGFKCGTEERNLKDISKLIENGKNKLSGVGITNRPTNTRYRDFRLALSVTGEYSQSFLTAAGTPATATDDVKRGVVLTAMNNTMTRVNGIFEKEFGAHFTVQNLPGIIFLDPVTDPYTNNLNLQLQQTLTANVGNANYDIGHVFHVGLNSGNAGGIGIICTNPTNNNSLAKGSAYSKSEIPAGDIFDLVVCHEMGHQLGANHTLSTWTEYSGANVEPGGGSTLMSYPGGRTIAPVQNDFDAKFHYKSISQVLNNLESKPNCGTQTNIAVNTAPVISALTAYTIPKGTAYYLEATAVDAQNDPVNYSWEQYDSVGYTNSICGDSGAGYNPEGALARTYVGTVSGRRYFPKLETVMNGTLTDKPGWETVSYVPRILNYAVVARDQNAQRPMLSTSETTVTVGNDGPFKFNGLTTSSALYNNASNIIKWEVANTNTAPYNVANVKIDYTADNGGTWTDLVTSTPNTGTYSVQMPANLNGSVKLRVSGINNIFYAISPAVNVGSAPTSVTSAPTGLSTIDKDITKTTAIISWNSVPGANYSINYRKVGTTNWSNTTSQTNSVLLNNLEDEMNYEVQVAAVVNNIPGAFSNNSTFKTKGLRTGVDYCLMTTGGALGIVSDQLMSGLMVMSLSNLAYSGNVGNAVKTYLDFSEDQSKIINLNRGSQYTLNYINVGNRSGVNDWFEAWIDFNRNGIFENTEKIVSRNAVPAADPALPGFRLHRGNANFTVPAEAYAGDKLLRMRVASTFDNAASGPCGSPVASSNQDIEGLSLGSFKDFSVRITDNSALAVNEVKNTTSEVSIYPNPADTFVEVKNLKGKADYKIYSADGRLVQEGKTDGQRINVSSLVKGMYMVTIKGEKDTYNIKLIKK